MDGDGPVSAPRFDGLVVSLPLVIALIPALFGAGNRAFLFFIPATDVFPARAFYAVPGWVWRAHAPPVFRQAWEQVLPQAEQPGAEREPDELRVRALAALRDERRALPDVTPGVEQLQSAGADWCEPALPDGLPAWDGSGLASWDAPAAPDAEAPAS